MRFKHETMSAISSTEIFLDEIMVSKIEMGRAIRLNPK